MCTIDLCSKSCGRGLSTRPSVYKHLTVEPECQQNDAADSDAMMVIATAAKCCLCLFTSHDLCLVFARVIMTLRMNCSTAETCLMSSRLHAIHFALRFVARAFMVLFSFISFRHDIWNPQTLCDFTTLAVETRNCFSNLCRIMFVSE